MSNDDLHIVTQEDEIVLSPNEPLVTMTSSQFPSPPPHIHPFFLSKKAIPVKSLVKQCHVKGCFRKGKFVNGYTRRFTKPTLSKAANITLAKPQEWVHVDPQLFILQHSLNVQEFKKNKGGDS